MIRFTIHEREVFLNPTRGRVSPVLDTASREAERRAGRCRSVSVSTFSGEVPLRVEVVAEPVEDFALYHLLRGYV